MNTLSRAGAFLLSASLITACGGGGGASGGGTTLGASAGAGDFLIQDAAVSSLLAFSATVNAVHLESAAATSANLLPAPVPVEFLGLQGTPAWLSTVDSLPQGTWDSIRVEFAPLSYSARANDGSSVAVSAISDSMIVTFAAPLVVDGTGYHRFEVDLDLLASVSGDPASPPLSFDPNGLVNDSDGSLEVEMDEFLGVISSADSATSSFVVDAFADDDLTLPLAQVTVQVSGTTLLHKEDGTVYADTASFFADLAAASTLLEIHGDLGANRIVNASKIDVEDQTAGASSSGQVKVEGLVTAIAPGVSFDLTIRDIEKGSSVADPVLLALGSPSTITVSFDATTAWFLDSSTVGSETSLMVGQEVKVRFSDFTTSPFPSGKVEIKDAFPEFEGTMTNAAGLPASLTMQMDSLEPAVLAGQVATSATDVSVDLSGASLTLDTEGQPSLTGVTLLSGLEVKVKGTISGLPTAPALVATEAEVRPGRLKKAVVSSTDLAGLAFTTSSGTVKDPFGGGLSSGPMNVIIDPACSWDGDVQSQPTFFSSFSNLGLGLSMEVEIKGLATANPNEIRAYEIKTSIQ